MSTAEPPERSGAGSASPGLAFEESQAAAPEQLTLAGVPAPRRRRAASSRPVAEVLPVARVAVDLMPAHLDRVFEYEVGAQMAQAAQPGVRVRVRFGAQQTTGYVLERAQVADHEGVLAPLRAVVSPERVLTPEVHRLARAVADRYAGTLAEVLRLAVPPRHARVEAEPWPEDATPHPAPHVGAAAWAQVRGGAAFVSHLAAGSAPRAVWTALPGRGELSWAAAIAQAVAACVLSGRGAVVVVPDARDVAHVAAALGAVGIEPWRPDVLGGYVSLQADDGPAARYRAYLAALRGRAQVVVGTRAAAFAPVRDLGLLVVWDDGDPLHAEPRAPYPHVREVIAMRAEQQSCGVLLGGHSRSTAAQRLVEAGWAHPVQADRAVVRERAPRVRALTSVELASEGASGASRLPGAAHRAVTKALASGPVLVQVPRAGYVPVVACERCRAVATCPACHGPLAMTAGDGVPSCAWCGALATDWRCGECGGKKLRSVRVGSQRTAEELGKAFPGVRVRQSGAAPGVLAAVPDEPAIVVATPGAEPVAEHGYACALLLDAAVATGHTGLYAAEDAVRRWFAAAALVRSQVEGGAVLLVGDGAPVPTQALVRWDPVGFAERELAERRELGLPPAVRIASVTGPRDAVQAVVGRLELPPGAEVLGPVPIGDAAAARTPVQGRLDDQVRMLVRVPVAGGAALSATLAASSAVRSARHEGGLVKIQIDPREVL